MEFASPFADGLGTSAWPWPANLDDAAALLAGGVVLSLLRTRRVGCAARPQPVA